MSNYKAELSNTAIDNIHGNIKQRVKMKLMDMDSFKDMTVRELNEVVSTITSITYCAMTEEMNDQRNKQIFAEQRRAKADAESKGKVDQYGNQIQ